MRHNQRGMTFVELIIAIVVIGVGLAGVMTAFSMVAKGSSDPVVHKQMLAIAEEMMEEITLKQFTIQANGATVNACARDTWNDLRDYHDYDSSTTTCKSGGPAAATPTVYDVTGTAIGPSGYSVAVTAVNPGAAWNSIPASDVIRITVTVRRGPETLQVIGWRTNY